MKHHYLINTMHAWIFDIEELASVFSFDGPEFISTDARFLTKSLLALFHLASLWNNERAMLHSVKIPVVCVCEDPVGDMRSLIVKTIEKSPCDRHPTAPLMKVSHEEGSH